MNDDMYDDKKIFNFNLYVYKSSIYIWSMDY